MDPVWLSRIQFGLTVGFHYIFPTLTIGMGGVLVYLEAMHLRTREPIYEVAAAYDREEKLRSARKWYLKVLEAKADHPMTLYRLGLLEFDDDIFNIGTDARLVLGEQIRHSILSLTVPGEQIDI